MTSKLLTLFLVVVLTLTFQASLPVQSSTINLPCDMQLPKDWPVVYVYPSNVTAFIGENFTVSVIIYNLTDGYDVDPVTGLKAPLGNLYGLDIEFSWDPAILQYVDHTFTVPFEDYPNPVQPSPYPGILHEPVCRVKEEINETGDIPGALNPETRAWFAYASMLPAPVFNGDGTFVTLTFNVKASGVSHLKLVNVWLSDDTGTGLLFHQFDGFFGECADSFQLPLDGLWTVSQRFGGHSYDWNGYHLGEDVLRNFEAPVFAPADGIVKHNAKRTDYGYVVIIEHLLMDGTFVCSVLGHLKQAGRVPVGTKVTKGQIVGYLSSVPEESGGIIHLHFGIRKEMYSEELDFDGKWRYRGYGPIDIVGSWCPPSDFIEYYNLDKEAPPSYNLTINTEGGGAAASSTSVFTLVYNTVLTLVALQPWWIRWSGTDNDYQNPTMVTIDFHKLVTAWFRSEPPPPCPTPWELAKSLIGADYSGGGQGWPWDLVSQGSHKGGRWLSKDEIIAGYYYYVDPAERVFGHGVDCSGLVFWAYNKWAYENSNGGYAKSLTDSANMIYMYANAQYLKTSNSDPIGKEELQPGDLLFFEAIAGNGKDPDHVAMYVGDFPYKGQTCNVVHATITINGLVKKVTPARYDPSIETLFTPNPEWPGESLVVNRGYGRVFNHSDGVTPSYMCKSPIDLVVTDPDGVVLTKDVGEISGMFYVEFDTDGDGELDDTVVVWDPKNGDYSIALVPEPGALPTDDFTLEASASGTIILLADCALISEVPTNPYIIAQNETAIMLRNINIATTNVTSSKSVVGQGYLSSINVTVQNQGNLAETFNITLHANSILITSQTITLPSGTSTTITFTWNTTGFAYGNYTLWACAEPVPEEAYLGDNTFVYGWVIVSIPGDVDGDFDVDIYDVVKITGIYHSKRGDPQFNPNSDLDNDGEIKIYDVVRCTSHYGQKDP